MSNSQGLTPVGAIVGTDDLVWLDDEARKHRRGEETARDCMPGAVSVFSAAAARYERVACELRELRARIEALEWAIVRTLYAGDIDPPNPTAPFWFREQLLTDAGLTMERCRELMDLHRGEDRVARL